MRDDRRVAWVLRPHRTNEELVADAAVKLRSVVASVQLLSDATASAERSFRDLARTLERP